MSRRTFRRVPVRRADFGPAQPGFRITCGRCRTVDEVVVKGTLEDVGQRFRAAGWLVGNREDDDRCPSCNPRRRAPQTEVLPMVKIVSARAETAPLLSTEAILQRKIVYDILFERIDHGERRYLPGWSDARVAAETKMAEAFVAGFREENFGPFAAPPSDERLKALAAAFETTGVTQFHRIDESITAVRTALVDLAAAMKDTRGLIVAHVAALRRLSGEK